MQDLLCQFFTKINECITVSNETIDLAKWLVNEGLEIEVVKKLMMWLDDGTLEEIINFNIFNSLNNKLNSVKLNIKDLGCSGDGNNDDTMFIKKALDIIQSNGGGILYFPDGTYLWNEMLEIPSNTKILSDKETLHIRNHAGSFLINGSVNKSYPLPYSANCNITIEGGQWDGNPSRQETSYNMLNFGKGDTINIKNVTFLNYCSHVLDISGCKNVVIENCCFKGFRPLEGREFAEAIQIAEHTEKGFSGIQDWDYSICENVTISNCYFGKSSVLNQGCNGVGGHSATHNVFNKNIKIVNNVFENSYNAGIRVFKWKDVFIKNNMFKNCKHGVVISSTVGGSESSNDVNGNQTYLSQAGSDIFVENNTFINSEMADVYLSGQTSNVNNIESLARIKNVVIKSNISNGSKNRFINAKIAECVFISDNIVNDFRGGIYGNDINNIVVSNNILNKASVDGVNISSSDTVNIKDNVIKETQYSAILTSNVKNFLIEKNQLNRVCLLEINVRSGINVSTNSICGIVRDNLSDENTQCKHGVEVTKTCSNVIESNNRVFGVISNVGLYNEIDNVTNVSEIYLTDNQNKTRFITPIKEIFVTLLGDTTAYDEDRSPFGVMLNKEIIHIQGLLKNVVPSQSNPIARVSQAYAPKSTKIFTVPISTSTSGGYGVVGVTPSGNIFLYYLSKDSVNTIALDGLSWILQK